MTIIGNFLVLLNGCEKFMLPENYKKPHIRLSGEDGNGFVIASRGRSILEKEGYDKEVIEAYWTEVLDGDYDHLLQTMMKWFDVS